ncbi:MAG: hypothetical protein J5706_04740 [Elusimicrobiales bacterium]|nr:hypothetical protein [Elusimicrobiales bacterium]
MEDGKATLRSKIRVHDKHRLEIKLDFDLDDVDKTSYSVETYFFIPRSLNIGPHNYHKEQFYDSCQRYIRFSTPKISLSRMCDYGLEYSPLTRIRMKMKEIQAGDNSTGLIEKICYEIKLLGCAVRGELRDNVKQFIEDYRSSGISTVLENTINAFLTDFSNFLKEFDSLRTEMSVPIVPVKVKETFAFCDEYVSLSIEEHLGNLAYRMQNIPEFKTRESVKSFHNTITKLVNEEEQYRRERSYPSVFDKKSSNELLIYRRGMLKKFVSAVLFIRAEFSEWEALTQIIFGFAAGVAMLFATVISVYYQNRYTTTSVPFVTALVISYIFKDRIKDWIKFSFSKKLAHWISDRRIDVIDPDTFKSIGELKEGFTFIKHENLPPDVGRLRNADFFTSVDPEGRPERIFKYKKNIKLKPRAIMRNHARRKGINDIMRFNMARLIQQADDPVADYKYYDPSSGMMENAGCARVYHINVIVRYTYVDRDGEEKEYFERHRLVVNKNGIIRKEEVR